MRAVSFQRFEPPSFLSDYGQECMRPKVSIENLVIPYFVTFDINDETRKKYEEEKECILQFYQDHDFTERTLECLLEKENASA